MKTLTIDTSGGPCSAAIYFDEKLVCEAYLHDQRTHSAGLMPLVDDCLTRANISINDIDAFGVVVGPGSFTGLRIGICTVKGMADALCRPVVSVDTLEALSLNAGETDMLICPMLDARRDQVYDAGFRCGVRMWEDRAESIDELIERVIDEQAVLFLGDGAEAQREYLKNTLPQARFMGPHLNFQRAGTAGLLTARAAMRGDVISSQDLRPNYIRDSQAQQKKVEDRHAKK